MQRLSTRSLQFLLVVEVDPFRSNFWVSSKWCAREKIFLRIAETAWLLFLGRMKVFEKNIYWNFCRFSKEVWILCLICAIMRILWLLRMIPSFPDWRRKHCAKKHPHLLFFFLKQILKSIKCNFGQFEVWKKWRDKKTKQQVWYCAKIFLQIVSYRIVGSICRSQFGGKNLTRYLFFLFWSRHFFQTSNCHLKNSL